MKLRHIMLFMHTFLVTLPLGRCFLLQPAAASLMLIDIGAALHRRTCPSLAAAAAAIRDACVAAMTPMKSGTPMLRG